MNKRIWELLESDVIRKLENGQYARVNIKRKKKIFSKKYRRRIEIIEYIDLS